MGFHNVSLSLETIRPLLFDCITDRLEKVYFAVELKTFVLIISNTKYLVV